MDYLHWARAQALAIETDIRARAARGDLDTAAVYFLPSTATEYARLVLGDETAAPSGATDCIRFPSPSGMHSRVGFVPRQHLAGGIAYACTRLPVFPQSL